MGVEEIYRRFAKIWADGEPVRDARDLFAAMLAADIDPDEVTDKWLRELSREWVYGRSEAPFADERTNREYRRAING